jgi:hypothetical protein
MTINLRNPSLTLSEFPQKVQGVSILLLLTNIEDISTGLNVIVSKVF